MSLHPIIHAQTRPNDPAVIMAGSGKQMTFGEMDAAANRFANLLRSKGLQEGDAFAVLLENRMEFFTLVWGSQRAGTMLVPISTRLTAPEIAYIIRDSEAKFLVTSAHFADLLEGIRAECEGLDVLVMDGEGAEGFAAQLDARYVAVQSPAHSRPVQMRRDLFDMGRFAGAVIALDHHAAVVAKSCQDRQRGVGIELVGRVDVGHALGALGEAMHHHVRIDAKHVTDRDFLGGSCFGIDRAVGHGVRPLG